jgi:hypothetical protein
MLRRRASCTPLVRRLVRPPNSKLILVQGQTQSPVVGPRLIENRLKIAVITPAPAGRHLSTTTTTTTAIGESSSSSSTSSDSKLSASEKDKKQKKGDGDDSNILLDNLGKIFLGAIGLVVLTLVRSSYGTTNKNNVRDMLEETAALDPLEIDDLRTANSELTPDVFRDIMKDLYLKFPNGRACYTDFVVSVRTTMKEMKGDSFTIELGHLMDRVVMAALNKRSKTEQDEVDLAFLLAALSLALDSSVKERIEILYEAMQQQQQTETEGKPTVQDVLDMVGYLQDTCQLVPSSQVVKSDQKYPTQQYHQGSPSELIQWDGKRSDAIDFDAFASILRSKSVCAWGECHNKRKNLQ